MRRPSAAVWQEFQDRVAELGGQVVEPEWLGVNTPHRVLCRVGHDVTPTPASLRIGRGLCRACAGKDPKAAWQAFQHRVTELGGRVVEPEWRGCQAPHRVTCREGHDASPRPNGVQQGGGICRTCAGNDSSATERAFRERVDALGGRIVESEWLGAKKPHRMVCSLGHECQPRPSDVLRGHGLCVTCAGKDPAVAEQAFREGIASLGGRVLEPTWLGARKPHRIVCGSGHVGTVHPATVARGGEACPTCAGRAPGQAWLAFRDRVARLGGQVVEPEWLGTDVRHRAVCRKGHNCAPQPADIGQGQGICRICAGNDPAAAWQEFRDRVTNLGGRVIEPQWLGSDTPHRVTCKERHETAVRPGSVRGGQGLCRFCAGKSWDVFYVVTNESQGRVKFGITSGDPRRRLGDHRRNGYRATERLVVGMPDAADLESSILAALRLAGITPVRGREYYDIAVLASILSITDSWRRAA